MLNRIVLSTSTSPRFRPIVVGKIWLILSCYIRNTFGDLNIDLIKSRVFPFNPISFNLCTKSFRQIDSYTLFESQQNKSKMLSFTYSFLNQTKKCKYMVNCSVIFPKACLGR